MYVEPIIIISTLSAPIIPHGYSCNVLGFVEELVINDDPEYQWIDKIRTPRASNEARQINFIKLSGQVYIILHLFTLCRKGLQLSGHFRFNEKLV